MELLDLLKKNKTQKWSFNASRKRIGLPLVISEERIYSGLNVLCLSAVKYEVNAGYTSGLRELGSIALNTCFING